MHGRLRRSGRKYNAPPERYLATDNRGGSSGKWQHQPDDHGGKWRRSATQTSSQRAVNQAARTQSTRAFNGIANDMINTFGAGAVMLAAKSYLWHEASRSSGQANRRLQQFLRQSTPSTRCWTRWLGWRLVIGSAAPCLAGRRLRMFRRLTLRLVILR